jgi:hypothetical protein
MHVVSTFPRLVFSQSIEEIEQMLAFLLISRIAILSHRSVGLSGACGFDRYKPLCVPINQQCHASASCASGKLISLHEAFRSHMLTSDCSYRKNKELLYK